MCFFFHGHKTGRYDMAATYFVTNLSPDRNLHGHNLRVQTRVQNCSKIPKRPLLTHQSLEVDGLVLRRRILSVSCALVLVNLLRLHFSSRAEECSVD